MNSNPQPDLLAELLESSSMGKEANSWYKPWKTSSLDHPPPHTHSLSSPTLRMSRGQGQGRVGDELEGASYGTVGGWGAVAGLTDWRRRANVRSGRRGLSEPSFCTSFILTSQGAAPLATPLPFLSELGDIYKRQEQRYQKNRMGKLYTFTLKITLGGKEHRKQPKKAPCQGIDHETLEFLEFFKNNRSLLKQDRKSVV